MKTLVTAAFLLGSCLPALAKTHGYVYEMPCAQLWPAVKDTLRNSGKYQVISMESTEMTASYNIGSILTSKRTNSLVLNAKDAGCELQVQTSFSGFTNDDSGDLKKRVDDSLKKLGQTPAAKPVPTPSPAALPQ